MRNLRPVAALFLYGGVILYFGISGYINGGSIASCIAGSISALFLWASAILFPFRARLALFMGMIISALLTALFTYRSIGSDKMTPTMLGLISATILIYLFLQKKRSF